MVRLDPSHLSSYFLHWCIHIHRIASNVVADISVQWEMTIVVIFSTSIFRSQWPLLHPLQHPADPPLSLGISFLSSNHKMYLSGANVKIYIGYRWKCKHSWVINWCCEIWIHRWAWMNCVLGFWKSIFSQKVFLSPISLPGLRNEF